jgi:signal transduction histidine kinase
VRLSDFAASSTVRSSLVAAGAFSAAILILFGFVYWQTQSYVTDQIDRSLTQEVSNLEERDPARVANVVGERLLQVPRQFDFAGLFTPDGRREAGNLAAIPPELVLGQPAREIIVQGPAGSEPGKVAVRAIARRLPDGRMLVIGRNLMLVRELAEIMAGTLAIGAVPACLFALLIGILLAIRGEKRVERVNQSIRRIIAGNLRERLPTHGANDPFDKLATSVNHMLAEIEALLHSIAGAGDDMAHELRTPLTRVRARLERARNKAGSLETMQATLDEAVLEIDQSLAIVTALLRIAEIEHSRRLAGFGTVALAPLLREVHEFYEPTAEAKGVSLHLDSPVDSKIVGDHDLLFEAVANLVDNAVKFTPAGGNVAIALVNDGAGPVLRVTDSGPGINEAEREAVTKRFYRSDKSRHETGTGLGLSLVAAIAKLHGFTLRLSGKSGCVAEIVCRATP